MLSKLPSKIAAMVPRDEYADALRTAGISAKGPRFVNFAELAALEALKVHALCQAQHRLICCDGVCLRSQHECDE